MKALNEIGYKKTIKYLFFSLWHYLFALMFVSPMRVLLLRLFGARVGSNTIIERIRFINLYRTGLKGLTVGNDCFLGDGVTLDLANKIILGDHVTLSVDCLILTHANVGYINHPLQKSMPAISKLVRIDRGCFIGARAILLAGVVVHECSAVAAGSIVLADISQHTLVGGIPAKTIKTI